MGKELSPEARKKLVMQMARNIPIYEAKQRAENAAKSGKGA